MRTKDEINKDLKTSMVDLNLLVEASIQNEQDFEEKRNNLEKYIKALDVEVSYENTLAGQIDEHVVDTRKEIQVFLDKLTQTTGVELHFQLIHKSEAPLNFKITKPPFAFPYQKEAFKKAVEKILIDPYITKEMRIDKVLILIDEIFFK